MRCMVVLSGVTVQFICIFFYSSNRTIMSLHRFLLSSVLRRHILFVGDLVKFLIGVHGMHPLKLTNTAINNIYPNKALVKAHCLVQ